MRLWDNIGSLVLAILLALLVWVVVITNDDPSETRVIGSPVPIEYEGLRQGLLEVGEAPPVDGTVSIRAPVSVWGQMAPEDVRLRVDMTGLGEGTHELRVVPSVAFQPARIDSYDPQVVTISLERAASASYDVEVVTIGDPQLGYRTSSSLAEPDRAIIFGAASLVERVSGVRAVVNVSDRRENFQQETNLIPVDSEGNPVTGLEEVNPATAAVAVSIEPRERFQLVSVVPNLEGEEALAGVGYRMTDVSVTPEVVTVFSSDPDALQDLPGFVFTEAFDVSNATGDLERRLSLDLPQGVSPVEGQGVLVKVSVIPVEGTITVRRDIETRGLGQGLFAELSPDAVDIILNGPLPTLNTLRLEDVRVIIDLLDLALGVHQVASEVIIGPTDVEHEPVFPSAIEVTITNVPPPTPTP